MKSVTYNKDYFEFGKQLGISGYENYRWLETSTVKMCESLVEFASLRKDEKIVDFGCAKGFLVKGLFILGYDCYGVDISEYAINNSDPLVSDRLSIVDERFYLSNYDCIICKDVLEHLDYNDLDNMLNNFSKISKKLVVIVPLGNNNKYVVPDYENDFTHIIREDLEWWKSKIENHGFTTRKSTYRVEGIKDNWSSYEQGNGFFVFEKVK